MPTSASDLYETLYTRFGSQSDADIWWPVRHGPTDPPEFERYISNILVLQTSWEQQVLGALDALAAASLLTARALAQAPIKQITACIHATGYTVSKARYLKDGCSHILADYATEARFCVEATRPYLLNLPGIGPDGADRNLLFVCQRVTPEAFPVDTYCLRVWAFHGLIDSMPTTMAERRRTIAAIKVRVERELPHELVAWQRMHALMQLEGTRLRGLGITFRTQGTNQRPRQ